VVMHPSRWGWITAALDGATAGVGRPLVVPTGAGAFNAMATMDNNAEGIVGGIQGLPVVADGNIPTNFGAGTNQDRIIVGRFAEAYLFEGVARFRVLMEVLSGTLQVRLQLWNYVGTGLTAAAGF